jgi:membrane protease subunit (stomatin/prohibitin family)
MGNRCYVIFPDAQAAVYLHWNGGLESVVSFLDYMNERNVRGDSYGAARFCQIVGNFFGGELSIGVHGCADPAAMAYKENGAFVIDLQDGALAITRWLRERRGSERELYEITGDKLNAAITAARAHAYNRDGAMLADIRAKNAPAAKENAGA